MFKNSKAPLIVILIVSLVLIFSITSYFVFANVVSPEIGNHYFEDYKVVRYNGVILAAEKSPLCTYKPDYRNDGYKECSSELIIWNRGDSSISLDMVEDNFDFAITKPYKEDSLDLYYSVNYEIYKEERNNRTSGEVYNTSKVRFSDWKPLDDSTRDLQSDEIIGVKFNFEFPQYEKASYNITYKPLNWLLDPDVSSCGTLSTEGATYTQTANIIPTADTNCIIITAENITYNGAGYWIKNSTNSNTGIYSNQYNTTIKNCNITMGRDGGAVGTGITLEEANNSYIYNNTLKGYYGLSFTKLSSTSNAKVENNTANNNTEDGFYISCDYNNTFNNNIANNNSGAGFYIDESDNNTFNNNTANNNTIAFEIAYSHNNTFTNNTINSNTAGITICYSHNNTFTNNIINESTYGVMILTDGNIIQNNTINSNTVGIYFEESGNNTVQNNTVNNNGYGVALFATYGNDTIKNNTLHSNNISIVLDDSNRNTIQNNDIWNCSRTCIRIVTESDYNVFDGNKINKSSGIGINITTGIVVGGGVSHNLFKNTNMTNIDGTSILFEGYPESDRLNNTFLNFSYNNESVNANSQLIRKWYFNGQVNFTHNSSAVPNANVTAFNSSTFQFSVLSAANGSIPQQELMEYINDGGVKSYYTNYTINASLTGWDTDSEEINLTTSILQQFNLADTTNPQITLVYPTNTSYDTIQTELNYSYSDLHVDACWYSTNGGATNTTRADCSNVTGLNSGQGSSTWLVGVNDTSGNENYSTITFFVDSIKPIPLIVYPTNTTHSTNVSELNYTYTETNPSRCWYSTDGGANNASHVACGTNFTTITSTEGSNTWTLYMNDTLGHENSTSITFFKDSISPVVTITSPTNNTNTTVTTLNIEYTYAEVNCDTVWWENGTGGSNTTLASCGTNITTPVWGEGKHNVTVFMNDTANNIGEAYVSFTIDTTNPQIDYGANIEINNSNVTVSHIFVNVTVTEINEKNITFLLHNQTAQVNSTTFTDGTRTINWTNFPDDRYTYNVTIYDYANNTNTTVTRTITLDSTPPIITIAFPQSGAGYSNNDSISLNYTVTDPLVGIDSCWYKIVNSTSDLIIDNTTIADCANTTFALVGGDIDYNLTLYSNDSLDNVNSSTVEFGIRTITPAIVLDAPSNNEWFASGTNIYFNYTTTDDDGLDTCQLWGNWTGAWHKNYTWVGPTSGSQNFTIVTIPEVISIWAIWCNDTLNNNAFSVNNFTLGIDETNPTISYESETPVDYSNLSQSNIYVNVTWVEINLANIIFSLYNDTATVNSTTFTTATYDINWTGLNDDNNYTYEVNITDNANNKNYTALRHITLDTGNPETNLTIPINNTNTSTVAQNMTTNLSDALGIKNATLNIYNQTSGNLINSTITTFVADILTKTLGIVYTFIDGIYDWFYKVFDWAGNSAESGNYTITIDTTNPQITLVYPTNTSYDTIQTELNYSYSDSGVGVIDACWYSTDGGATNTTDATCTNLTGLNSGQGSSTWLIGINDTANNKNYSLVQFFVDTIEPSISLDAPTDHQNLSNGTNVYFNYTATDVGGLDTCQLWHNATGIWHKNYTWVGPTSGIQNYTTVNISEGRFKWNIWCNDTLNNVNWSISNYTFTVDETIPNVTITTANNTRVTDTLSITIEYNISDTNIGSCYFTLRTPGGLVHNYPENTSLNCASTSRSISTLWYGTFVVQFWGEDYAGNLGDANLTFITYFSGGGPGGGNGEPIVEEEEEVITRSFCGDGICQAEGNDYGIKEDWYNCQIDCQPFDFDALIYSFSKYCFDDDISTVCFWTQMLFTTVPGMGEEIVKDKTVYKDGQVCIGEICERLSGKTLFSNCIDEDPTTPCFWKSNAAFFILFLGGSTALALTFVRVRVSGRREKVNPYKYLQLKIKGRKKRKWR